MSPFKSGQFFRTIWRVNATLILAVGVLVLVVLSGVIYTFVRDATRPRQVDNVANTVVSEVEQRKVRLGNFEKLPGLELLRAPLHVEESYRFAASGKEADSTRNYLYFDLVTRSTRWLKPGFDGLILDDKALPYSEYGKPSQKALVNVHVVVSRDTNQDKRLSAFDEKQIAVSRPDGSGFRILIPSADKLNQAMLVRGDTLLILFSQGKKLRALEIAASELEATPKTYDMDIGGDLSLGS
jgi:hypothetical protein